KSFTVKEALNVDGPGVSKRFPRKVHEDLVDLLDDSLVHPHLGNHAHAPSRYPDPGHNDRVTVYVEHVYRIFLTLPHPLNHVTWGPGSVEEVPFTVVDRNPSCSPAPSRLYHDRDLHIHVFLVQRIR